MLVEDSTDMFRSDGNGHAMLASYKSRKQILPFILEDVGIVEIVCIWCPFASNENHVCVELFIYGNKW